MDLDPQAAVVHRELHRALHGAAVGDAAFELHGDVRRHQGGVEVRLLHLGDLDVDLLLGELRQHFAQLVDVLALAADDQAGARGLDRDADSYNFV